MLIRALAYSKQYNEAARVLKELIIKNPNWSSMGLLEKPLVQGIANECNLDFDMIWNPMRKTQITDIHSDEENEEIQEVVRYNAQNNS